MDLENRTEYRVTFGQRYRREEHPMLGTIDVDGWYVVKALHREQAVRIVQEQLGSDWADLRRWDAMTPVMWQRYFPSGQVGTL